MGRSSDRLYRKYEGGPFYGWFYGPTGRREVVATRSRDREVARKILRSAERAAHSPGGRAAHEGTVEDALEYFVSEGLGDRAAATADQYTRKAGHLLRLLGGVSRVELSRDHVQAFINRRLEEGAARGTLTKELVVLRLALKLDYERGRLAVHPAALIPRFRSPYVPKDRYLTEKEYARLLGVLPEERRLWLQIAVLTGARYSEIERLRWEEHVNLDAAWILLPGTKTAKARRRVPIAPPLLEVLAAEQRRTGTLVEPWGNVRRDLAAACAALGIPRVSPNDLRRTFGSWLKQRSVDSAVVARLMGHGSTRMVDLVYGKLDQATLQRAVELLPEIAPAAIPVSGSKWVADPVQNGGQQSRKRRRRPNGDRGDRAKADPAKTPATASKRAPAGKTKAASLSERRPLVVPRDGIEPPTQGFSIPCSTS